MTFFLFGLCSNVKHVCLYWTSSSCRIDRESVSEDAIPSVKTQLILHQRPPKTHTQLHSNFSQKQPQGLQQKKKKGKRDKTIKKTHKLSVHSPRSPPPHLPACTWRETDTKKAGTQRSWTMMVKKWPSTVELTLYYFHRRFDRGQNVKQQISTFFSPSI